MGHRRIGPVEDLKLAVEHRDVAGVQVAMYDAGRNVVLGKLLTDPQQRRRGGSQSRIQLVAEYSPRIRIIEQRLQLGRQRVQAPIMQPGRKQLLDLPCQRDLHATIRRHRRYA